MTVAFRISGDHTKEGSAELPLPPLPLAGEGSKSAAASPNPASFSFDAYSPKEIAERVENVGVTKARLPLLQMVMLSVLAGAFIGLGALYFVLVYYVIYRLQSK